MLDNDTEDRNVGLPLIGTSEEREKLRLARDTAYQESLMKDQAKEEKKKNNQYRWLDINKMIIQELYSY